MPIVGFGLDFGNFAVVFIGIVIIWEFSRPFGGRFFFGGEKKKLNDK